MYDYLLRPLGWVEGIGAAAERRLQAQGMKTAGDLLLHLPKGYRDDRTLTPVAALRPGEEARVGGRVLARRAEGQGRRMRVLVRLADETGEIVLSFFHSPYLLRDARLAPGQRLTVRGRAELWRGQWRMSHPEWLPLDRFTPGITPLYSALAGFSSRRLAGWIGWLLARLPLEASSPLDAQLARFSPLSLAQALRGIHAPDIATDRRACLTRIKLEEIWVYLTLIRRKRQAARKPAPAMRHDTLAARLIASLPHPLTDAQAGAWREIKADLYTGRRMHRLLQGDVGAGKTWIAALALAHAHDNGWQGALLAPTEVLAAQHAAGLRALLAPLGCAPALLTGGMRTAERRRLLRDLAEGRIACVVGTHALLREDVHFHRLGLAIVDEQHRFGVRQRWALAEHPHAGHADAVHLLAMTATPIPRSLALALYGDMDLSLMRGMPPGRKPVETRVLTVERMPALLAGMRRILADGGRIYWIVPHVEAREDGVSVEQRVAWLRARFPDAGVLGLHGRLKGADKRTRLHAFAEGDCRLLVATTVIEVGVNVPEARLIVIERAERYGLAQLHQLRGRVGRASAQGYCILLTDEALGEAGRRRLATMVDCHDGLALAEADLEMRGAGDALGVQQSGEAGFRVVDVVADHALIREAHAAYCEIALDSRMAQFWRPERVAVD
ncbi:MAG: ATP-dependent DNA helicase RecG [Zetaproteobacteria bacterium]|nr:MAG: ATP-dependent DNA helicase RecG [Zetaproteobacteria bacterium]